MAITSVPVLASSNTSALFQIKIDSLDFATRVVLSQESKKDGKRYLVVFFSKSFLPVEYNYEIYDIEMLAIIYTFKEW